MEIDVKSFSNVLMVAVIMSLIGVTLSLGSVEDGLAARATGSKSKSTKNGSTPKKKTVK